MWGQVGVEGRKVVGASVRARCDLCEAVTTGPRGSKRHHFETAHPEYQFHPKGESLGCGLCNASIASYAALVGHYRAVHPGALETSPKPESVPNTGRQVLDSTLAITRAGLDPRVELWEGCWEVHNRMRLQLGILQNRVEGLTRDLDRAKDAVVRLKEENDRLKATTKALSDQETMKVLRQAASAIATPGEGSLVER